MHVWRRSTREREIYIHIYIYIYISIYTYIHTYIHGVSRIGFSILVGEEQEKRKERVMDGV